MKIKKMLGVITNAALIWLFIYFVIWKNMTGSIIISLVASALMYAAIDKFKLKEVIKNRGKKEE